MSSSDKAKSKLLDSMRMSKQGSNEAPDANEPAAPAKAAAEKKAPATKAKAAAPRKPKAAAKSSAPKKPVTDNFQAAQRVWPD